MMYAVSRYGLKLNSSISYKMIERLPIMVQSQRYERDAKSFSSRGRKRAETIKNHKKITRSSAYRFVDRVRVRAKGGSGGKGCISHESQLGSRYKKRPNGGHGGNGGFVFIVADEKEQSLNMSSHHFTADDGKNGTSQNAHGRKGKNKIIRVPCGVVVRRILGYDEVWDEDERLVRRLDLEELDTGDYDYSLDETSLKNEDQYTGKKDHNKHTHRDTSSDVKLALQSQEYKFPQFDANFYTRDSLKGVNLVSTNELKHDSVGREEVIIADLDKHGSYVMVAAGGRGGVGNGAYASKHSFTPDFVSTIVKRSVGVPGESAYLDLELKMIADIGLVGYPNAGKSSILAAMSKAKPLIAAYPFTTLVPHIGCVEYRDGSRVLLADVPGLIDGASDGRGRGYEFLKHIERTRALIYVVDAAGVDGRDPVKDMRVLFEEISSYGDGSMITKPSLIVMNKIDRVEDIDHQNEIVMAIELAAEKAGVNLNSKILSISAGVSGEGLFSLAEAIRNVIVHE